MRVESVGRAAAVSRLLKKSSPSNFLWDLRCKSVCSSTELVLSRWLKEKPYLENSRFPRAVLALQQRHGKGQYGREWQSSRGGVWISAAFPWFYEKKYAGILGLAVAFALVERIEKYDLPVKIKWPNDLVVGEKKLAGILPGLIYRGNDVRFARIGLGLNVYNNVPFEGVALRRLIGPGKSRLNPWIVETLFAFERAMSFSHQIDWLRDQIAQRLWAKEFLDRASGEAWRINGISSDGGLKVLNSLGEIVLRR